MELQEVVLELQEVALEFQRVVFEFQEVILHGFGRAAPKCRDLGAQPSGSRWFGGAGPQRAGATRGASPRDGEVQGAALLGLKLFRQPFEKL